MLLVATMAATMFAGCGNDSGKKGSSGGAKEFDAFFATSGKQCCCHSSHKQHAYKFFSSHIVMSSLLIT
jgi:hypothetical protein